MPEQIELPDLYGRTMQLRQDSIDEQSRSFQAVVATETPTQVLDRRTFNMIDEILLARGGQFPDSVPMLDDHDRFNGSLSVIGSFRDFEQAASGREWRGRGFIANGDRENVREIWQMIVDRHLRDVSIGYRPTNFVDIPAGRTQTVARRQFTAGERTLRVTTEWTVHEVSVTPIGADAAAKIRSRQAHAQPNTPKSRSIFR